MNIHESIEYLQAHLQKPLDTLIILGSGFQSLVSDFGFYKKIAFAEIPSFSKTTAPGHESFLYFSKWKEQHVAIMAGRFHFYEGYDFEKIAYPIYVLKKLGIKNLILTNASGGLSERIQIGKPVLIRDFISFGFGSASCQVSSTISYAFHTGPNYGTPAEYQMLQKLNIDLVGMSTLPEILAAQNLNLNILAISVPVCTYFPPENISEPTEAEVFNASKKALPKVFKMITNHSWNSSPSSK